MSTRTEILLRKTNALDALRKVAVGPWVNQSVADWKCEAMDAVEAAAKAVAEYRNDVETVTEAKREQ